MKKPFLTELKAVLKNDFKTSFGFYAFMLMLLFTGVCWVLMDGAPDGAWWLVGIPAGLLLVNVIGQYLTRNESDHD